MATLRLKRGTSDPSASDFSNTAELLVNTTDGRLFTKDDSDNVVAIGTLITKANDGYASGALQINTTLSNYGTIQVRDSNQANISALQVENGNDGTDETNKVIRSVNLGSTAWATAAYHAKGHKFRISGETDTENALTLGSDKSATFAGDITAPTFVKSGGTSSQYLMADGSVSTGGGGGSSTLSGLTDVTISSASNGQVLKYNGSAWVNDTDATGGGGGGSTDLLEIMLFT